MYGTDVPSRPPPSRLPPSSFPPHTISILDIPKINLNLSHMGPKGISAGCPSPTLTPAPPRPQERLLPSSLLCTAGRCGKGHRTWPGVLVSCPQTPSSLALADRASLVRLLRILAGDSDWEARQENWKYKPEVIFLSLFVLFSNTSLVQTQLPPTTLCFWRGFGKVQSCLRIAGSYT